MSMFSQSFNIGNDTLNELVNGRYHPDSSNTTKPINSKNSSDLSDIDVIDESPNNRINLESSIASFRTRLKITKTEKVKRTGKKAKTNLKLTQTTNESNHLDNYSEFFRSDFELKNTTNSIGKIEPESNLEDYFKDSLILPPSNPIQNTKEIIDQNVRNQQEEDLAGMFSDISFDINSQSANEDCLNMGISDHNNESALNEILNSSSFKIQTTTNESFTQQLIWEDSEAFDCLPTSMDKILSQQQQPPLQPNDVENNFLELGIDNITFTENCFSMEQSNRQFIDNEMERCQSDVKAELSVHLELNDTFLNNSRQILAKSQVIIEQIPDNVVTATSQINLKDANNIKSWGLPDLIVQEYLAKGISTMFDWQVECLSNPEVIENYFPKLISMFGNRIFAGAISTFQFGIQRTDFSRQNIGQ